MALKISNETKVGALTAIAITLLILGFNFLKGRNFSSKKFFYAKFKSVEGLLVSNPVTINGFQIGTVSNIQESDQDLQNIIVELKIVKDVRIPNTAFATIKTSPLGASAIEINLDTLNNSTSYLKSGDTLRTTSTMGLLGSLTNKLDPVLKQVKGTVGVLDSILVSVNSTLDPRTKENLQGAIANINMATMSAVASINSLQKLLNTQTGALAKTLDNVAVFTRSLADNKGKVDNIMANVEKTTDNLSKMELDKTVHQLNDAISGLKITIDKVNSTNGSIGSLINDKKIYNNLTSTVNSLNLLLQDLRLHPKRYVNISVFGKKDKTTPLMKPMVEDSTTQEQTLH